MSTAKKTTTKTHTPLPKMPYSLRSSAEKSQEDISGLAALYWKAAHPHCLLDLSALGYYPHGQQAGVQESVA